MWYDCSRSFHFDKQVIKFIIEFYYSLSLAFLSFLLKIHFCNSFVFLCQFLFYFLCINIFERKFYILNS